MNINRTLPRQRPAEKLKGYLLDYFLHWEVLKELEAVCLKGFSRTFFRTKHM